MARFGGSAAITRGRTPWRVFDPALVRRESEENKPSFVLPYGRARVWPSEKQNTTNQIGKVMNKPGQGGSKLHVQGKCAHLILQWPDLADYLRKNSRVKDYRIRPLLATP
jgi:hypothetical protein